MKHQNFQRKILILSIGNNSTPKISFNKNFLNVRKSYYGDFFVFKIHLFSGDHLNNNFRYVLVTLNSVSIFFL